jgi:O-antigen/teichoic acid export membrane protein
LTGVDLRLARKLAKSGLGFISITLGSLLTLQGMMVLVAMQLGGTAVAIFSTSRTLTRLLAQLAVVSGKSMAPEVSALYGAGEQAAADRLIRRMTRLVLSAIVAGALVLAPLGSTIMAVWSHGKIPFNPPVFFLLLAAAVATSCWQIQSVRLTATNQHQLFATLFVSASALVLLLTYLGLPRFGIDAAAAGTLLTDLLMIVATFAAMRLTTWHRGSGKGSA